MTVSGVRNAVLAPTRAGSHRRLPASLGRPSSGRGLPPGEASCAGSDEAAVAAFEQREQERRRLPPALTWADFITALRAGSDLETLAWIQDLGRMTRIAVEVRVISSWANEEGQVFIRVQFGPERPGQCTLPIGRHNPNKAVHLVTLLAIDGTSIHAQPLGAWAEAAS